MCLQICFGIVCQCMCECCRLTLGSFKQQVRLSYVIQLIVCITLLFLVSWITPVLKFLTIFGISCPNNACIGVSVVYRMSFSLSVIHGFILLCLLCRNDFSRAINEGCGAFKILLLIGTFFGALFIPNGFFESFSTIAKVTSIFFLLFQMVMIIDICYLWNESWIRKYDRGATYYAYFLIVFTVLLYAFIFGLTIAMYMWFKGCGSSTLAITINLVLVIITGLLPFTGINPGSSIFTSSAVGSYTTYFTYAGLSNIPDTCNPVGESQMGPIVFLLTGLFLVVVSLLYVTFGDSEQSSGNLKVAPNTDLAKGVLDNRSESGDLDMESSRQKQKYQELPLKKAGANESHSNDTSIHEAQGADEEHAGGRISDYTRSNGYIYFHLIMLASALYVAMLLTNWGTHSANGETFSFKKNAESMWFMVSTAWITNGLYIWTLLAPVLFPDRNFS